MLQLKSLTSLTALTLMAVLMLSCSPATDSDSPNAVASKRGGPDLHKVQTDSERVVYDLVELQPFAESGYTPKAIEFQDLSDARYLTSGWSEFFDNVDGRSGSWTSSKSSAVDIPLARIRPLTIKITLSAPLPAYEKFKGSSPRFDKQYQIYWNGNFLQELRVLVQVREYELKIPAEVQVHGVNRLELQGPYWSKPTEATPGAPDYEPIVGARCMGIKFDQGDGRIPRYPDPVFVRDETLVQYPNTSASYYFPLPEKPVLEGSGRIVRKTKEAGSLVKGRVLVSLRHPHQEETELFVQELDPSLAEIPFKFEKLLEGEVGDFASIGLNFEFETPRDLSGLAESPFEVVWDDIRLRGRKEVIPESVWDYPREKTNVMVVLFDSMRADALAPYGNTYIKAPNFQSFASEGALLDAYSVTSWTRPSIASLMSGIYPSAHKTEDQTDSLSPDVPYLPQIMSDQGYKTICLTENVNSSKYRKFDRGYDEFFETYSKNDDFFHVAGPAEITWKMKLDSVLQPSLTEQPFFLFYHSLDPHLPYLPPEEYASMYDFGYRGDLKGTTEVLNMIDWDYLAIDQADKKHLRALYDGEITYADFVCGRILNRIRDLGLEENTLVVLLSDHGEEFWDHEWTRHGKTLYEEVGRIPMMIRLKGKIPEGQRAGFRAQIIDLAPTILDLVGAPVPEAMQGVSLLPYLVTPPEQHGERPAFLELNSKPQVMQALRYGKWKAIGSRTTAIRHMRPFQSWELYDLDEDPGELNNIWGREPIVSRVMMQHVHQQLLENLSLDFKKGESISLEETDPKVLEDLKALGYIQ